MKRKEEVRLGLVLYGGVSLAIYMNGMCLEFFRAIKGEGIYKLVKDLKDSEVVVDIISGSSAGGINGIMLACCLSNGWDFEYSKKIWIDSGDIVKLLALKRTSFSSLLDSEGYYQKSYEEFFEQLSKNEYVDEQERNSVLTELDLFITGTDFYGNFLKYDDKNSFTNVEIKNHDSLFLLKYRLNRKNHFKKYPKDTDIRDIFKSQAKLARITSAFPGAFSPVAILKDTPEFDKLREWGQLDKGRAYFFSDGGIVNNKPFTSTIEAIFSRNADRKVDRKLFYLEPDPEDFDFTYSNIEKPKFLNSIIRPFFGISSYQSIKEEIQTIRSRNSRLKKYFKYRDSLIESLFDNHFEKNFFNFNFNYYKTIRCEFFYKTQLEIMAADPVVSDNLIKLNKYYKENLNEVFSDLENYDAYFNQRRIYFIIYIIYSILYKQNDNFSLEKGSKSEVELHELWKKFNEINEVYEILKFFVHQYTGDYLQGYKGDDEKQMYTGLKDHVIVKFRQGNFKIEDEIVIDKYFRDKLYTELQEGVNKETGKTFFQILAEYENKIIRDFGNEKITNIYENFETLDSFLFPYELSSDILEKDIIDIVRFSSKGIQKGFSKFVKPKQRVLGMGFAHFSAFLKKSWRVNDILWGRLDGSSQIIDSLLDRSSVKNLNKINSFKPYIVNLSDNNDAELISLKETILNSSDETAQMKLFDDLKEKLIKYEQANILKTELPVLAKMGPKKLWENIDNMLTGNIDLEMYDKFFENDYKYLYKKVIKLSYLSKVWISTKTATALVGAFINSDKPITAIMVISRFILYPVLAFIFILIMLRKLVLKIIG